MRGLALVPVLVAARAHAAPHDAISAHGAAPDPASCTEEVPVVRAAPGGVEVDTTHYALYAQLDSREAFEIARMLEAASGAYARWFDRPAPATRLVVRVYADRPRYEDALRADGFAAHASAGGFTSTSSTNISYVLVQKTWDYTHVLVLHEAAHQFQQATRHPPVDLPSWYAEGLAEYLSRHDWDGRCVRLGTRPLVADDSPYDEAVHTLAGIGVGAVVASHEKMYGAGWALVRYLDTDAALRPRFAAFRDALDAGGHPDFATVVASPAALAAPIAAWLVGERAPLDPVFRDWLPRGGDELEGRAKYGSFATIVNPAATQLSAQVSNLHDDWQVGVVVTYTDDDHYVLVLHRSSGDVRAFRVNGDDTAWETLGHAPLPATGATGATGAGESISAELTGARASVTFNGTTVTVDAPKPRLGPAAYATTARFSKLSWR